MSSTVNTCIFDLWGVFYGGVYPSLGSTDSAKCAEWIYIKFSHFNYF